MGSQRDKNDPDMDDEAFERIEAHSYEAWRAATQAAKDLVEQVDPAHPDIDLIENIAARIEMCATVLTTVELRRTHHEVKTDLFRMATEDRRRHDSLIGTLERVVRAVEELEKRIGRLETKVGMLIMRTNVD